ncbi:hypothetical protein H8K52_05940 [Undibacterium seohonense]|uniref:Uncharacterized protein n=1 Tax=Undibacterium seohonense TaxID=1344950 RepID=A0ABR6X1R4_9BURK|nr:hypothetical protein [Undibacterium seohonense]MBC3806885.1 hypothetical protein [Undibacterium seohonense]
MHLVLILVVIAVLVLVIKQMNKQAAANSSVLSPSNPQSPWGSDTSISIAYLANGKLFYKDAHAVIEQVQSPYVQEMMDKMERQKERHAWKENTSFSVSANGGMRQFDKDFAQIMATSMQLIEAKQMLYFLKDDLMGGLFSMDLQTGEEKRILHKQNLALSDLNLDAASDNILCTSTSKDGSTNIAMIHRDGGQFQLLTGGDTFDSAPAWIPGSPTQILYQSAGIARAPSGYIAAVGNACIQMLDMKSSKVTPVLDDPQFDFLHPRVCPRGNLHFIRRPYEGQKSDMGGVLLDTLLFPFRLLRAVFHYLNFFSLMYSRKPLTSASGPAVKADLKEIMLKGKRIDAEKALRNAGTVQGVPSLVPSAWQLISRDRQGQEQVLATNVVDYDIRADGSIVYSNGRGAFLLEPGKPASLIMRTDLIEELVVAAV